MARGIVKGGLNDGGGSNIKSIQRGSVNFALYEISKTITISSIDTSKSIILVYDTNTASYPRDGCVAGEITNATTITLSRTANAVNALTGVQWVVIEFNNVKSKQTGTKTIASGTTGTAAISSVNLSKSLLFWSINDDSGSSPGVVAYMPEVTFASATSLSFLRTVDTGFSTYIYWQVIEFN